MSLAEKAEGNLDNDEEGSEQEKEDSESYGYHETPIKRWRTDVLTSDIQKTECGSLAWEHFLVFILLVTKSSVWEGAISRVGDTLLLSL